MRSLPVALATLALVTAGGCGGGGTAGGGNTGTGATTKKVFVVPHVLESSGRIGGVASADVDGDGILDLVVLNPDTSSVTTMLSSQLRESPSKQSLGKIGRAHV